MKNFLVTPLYLKRKRQELSDLKNKERQIAQKLGSAASFGGATLSKIPEYDTLVSEVQLLRALIVGTEKEIFSLRPVSPEFFPDDVISIVTSITITDMASGHDEEYYFTESGIQLPRGKALEITQSSPLGSILLGKKVGDTIEFDTPIGRRQLGVRAIRKIYP